MATDLTTLFGSEIKVAPQPYRPQRQYHGFPGAEGTTAMYLGSRGRVARISGTLRATGATYAIARATLADARNTIENYQALGALDYSFQGESFPNAILEDFKLVERNGKVYHIAGGYVTCQFEITLRCLV